MTFIYKQGASPCDNNSVFIILKWRLNGCVLVRTVGFVLSFSCVSPYVGSPRCVYAKTGKWTLSNGERDVMWWDISVCSCSGTPVRLPVIIQLVFQMAEVMLFVTNNLSLLFSNACTSVLVTGVRPSSVWFQIFAF